jgi:hypothetical protein
VRFGTGYDSIGSVTGAAHITAAADVRAGTAVDATTGSASIPAASDVRSTIPVDDTTGTVILPAEADVELGVGYGAGGTEYTGSWAGDGAFTSGDRNKLEAVFTKLPANYNIAGTNVVTTLESRLTEGRASNLDKLSDGTLDIRNASGNVGGKVLGGGTSTILATGAWALDHTGANLATALTAISNADLTAVRIAYLDNLNVGGPVASQAEAVAIQNNTRCVRVVPPQMQRPAEGSTVFRIELLLYDATGNMEAPDTAPTIGVVNSEGTSRDANLEATTMTLVSTGRYRSTYTVASDHPVEELIVAFSVTEGDAARIYANPAIVADVIAVDFTANDRLDLQATRQFTDKATSTVEPDGGNYRFTAASLANIPTTLTKQDVVDAGLMVPNGTPAAGSPQALLLDIPTTAELPQIVADGMYLLGSGVAVAGSMIYRLSAVGSASTYHTTLLDRLTSLLVEKGGGVYKFSTTALEEAPRVAKQDVADALLLVPNGNAAEGSPMAFLEMIESIGLDITLQQIADAMALATADEPAAGSVLAYLAEIYGKAATIAAGKPTATGGGVSTDGKTITLIQQTGYTLAEGTELRWTDTGETWRDLTGASGTLTILIGQAVVVNKEVVIDLTGDDPSVYAELTSEETAILAVTTGGKFNLQFAWPTGPGWTLPTTTGPGKVIVVANVTPVA